MSDLEDEKISAKLEALIRDLETIGPLWHKVLNLLRYLLRKYWFYE